jgi:hypothetical protein
MKRLILTLMLAASLTVGLTACGKTDRVIASWTGYTTLCIDGVEYIQFTSGASVAYTPDGRIKTCK